MKIDYTFQTIRSNPTEVTIASGKIRDIKHCKEEFGSMTYCAHENARSRAAKDPPTNGERG